MLNLLSCRCIYNVSCYKAYSSQVTMETKITYGQIAYTCIQVLQTFQIALQQVTKVYLRTRLHISVTNISGCLVNKIYLPSRKHKEVSNISVCYGNKGLLTGPNCIVLQTFQVALVTKVYLPARLHHQVYQTFLLSAPIGEFQIALVTKVYVPTVLQIYNLMT